MPAMPTSGSAMAIAPAPSMLAAVSLEPTSAPALLAPAGLIAALYEILDATVLLMEGDLGNIQLYNPARRTLEIAAQRGFPPEFAEVLGTITLDGGTAGARSLR